MTKEELREKIDKSGNECETCEYKVVPVRIEPCKSCSETNNNWEQCRRVYML